MRNSPRRPLYLATLALFAAAVMGGCEGGTDDAAARDTGFGGFDFVFGPNDTAGGGDTGAGVDVKDAATPADLRGDGEAADAVVPDVPGGDTGTPPSDTSRPDVPSDTATDTGDPCQPSGVGCPCAGDNFCLAWDDGDRCNGHLVCRGGRCAEDAASVVDCGVADGYCTDFVCRAATGSCEEVIHGLDGDDCEDGNPCTGGDTCAGGECVAGPLNTCGGGGCVESRALTCGVQHAVFTNIPTPNEPDPTFNIEQYACTPTAFPGPEKAYSIQLQPKTQAIFSINNPVMSMMLIPWGADCDVGACLGATSGTRKFYHKDESGGRYWLVVDTQVVSGQSGALKIDCHPQRAEQRIQCLPGNPSGDDCFVCDDDIDNDWDGLTDCDDDDCELDPWCAVCGDGHCVDPPEDAIECPEDCWECGDDICSEGYETPQTCPGDCPCGDGACTAAQDETCATCPADCGDCTMPCVEQDIVCGQTVSRSNLSDEDNELSGYTCGCADGGREERAFRFVSARTVTVGVQLAFEDPFDDFGRCSDDYDLYLLSGCNAAAECLSCANTSGCTEGLSFTAEAGVPYVIALEAATSTPWDDYDLRIVCN